MKKTTIHFFFLVCCILCFTNPVRLAAQDKDSSSVSLEVNADLVNCYIWRGLVGDLNPNIQPYITFTASNFEAGIWGSSNLDNTYREVDYWLSYSYKNFCLTLNDYFWRPYIDSLKYFDWNDKTTGHSLELSLEWEGPESFPVKLTAATFVYGADKKIDHFDPLQEPVLKNQYSSYFEVSYPFKIKDTEVNAFIGGTPAESFYATEASVVNLGLMAKKSIKITDKYSLPIFGSFVVNPEANNVFLIFGLNL